MQQLQENFTIKGIIIAEQSQQQLLGKRKNSSSEAQQQSFLNQLLASKKDVTSTIENKSQKFKCLQPKCGKEYTIKKNLLHHQETKHSGEKKKFICPESGCGKQYSEKGNLTVHQRKHSGLQPFKCDYCEKRFSSIGNRNDHQKRHNKQKDYACEYCEAKYYRKYQLTHHIESRHQAKQKSQTVPIRKLTDLDFQMDPQMFIDNEVQDSQKRILCHKNKEDLHCKTCKATLQSNSNPLNKELKELETNFTQQQNFCSSPSSLPYEKVIQTQNALPFHKTWSAPSKDFFFQYQDVEQNCSSNFSLSGDDGVDSFSSNLEMPLRMSFSQSFFDFKEFEIESSANNDRREEMFNFQLTNTYQQFSPSSCDILDA